MCQDLEERTRYLEENNFSLEPDIFTECELLDVEELIVEETADRVTDSDPQINIYIPTQCEESDLTDYILNDILID